MLAESSAQGAPYIWFEKSERKLSPNVVSVLTHPTTANYGTIARPSPRKRYVPAGRLGSTVYYLSVVGHCDIGQFASQLKSTCVLLSPASEDLVSITPNGMSAE